MRHGIVGLGLLLLVLISAAGPYPAPWKWSPETQPPTLSLNLGSEPFEHAWTIPQATREIVLVLNKYLMIEDGVTLEWKSDGAPWFWRQKKIPGESSTELVPLPPGNVITLQIRTRSGVRLADLTLKR